MYNSNLECSSAYPVLPLMTMSHIGLMKHAITRCVQRQVCALSHGDQAGLPRQGCSPVRKGSQAQHCVQQQSVCVSLSACVHDDHWAQALSLHMVYYATHAEDIADGHLTRASTPWMLAAVAFKVDRAANMSYRLLMCL